MIPKVIHYCWFGGNEKPESVNRCIDSWKKFCPTYQIVEWNESNFDVDSVPFIKQALEVKKYAFASDLARLIIVYNNGGFYFDTDVELVKSLDALCEKEIFFGFENESFVASGLGFGSEKGNKFLLEHINQYKDVNFINEDGSLNMKGCPVYLTELLTEKGYIPNGKYQIVDGVTLFPPDYFNPYDNATGKLKLTDNTVSIHWYDTSWNKESKSARKIKQLIHRVFGNSSLLWIKKLLGK